MNTSARFYLLLDSIYYITRDIYLKLNNHVYSLIQFSIRRVHFLLSFCQLICMFITCVKYDIYCMTVLHGQRPMLYNKYVY